MSSESDICPQECLLDLLLGRCKMIAEPFAICYKARFQVKGGLAGWMIRILHLCPL